MTKLSCTIDGVNYESINADGKVLRIGFSTVHYRLHSYNYPEYVQNITQRRGAELSFCTIRGVEYATIADAEGLTRERIRQKGTRKNLIPE